MRGMNFNKELEQQLLPQLPTAETSLPALFVEEWQDLMRVLEAILRLAALIGIKEIMAKPLQTISPSPSPSTSASKPFHRFRG
jgi:hypothetical protein